MKAEHRHQLQTNVLADRMGRLVQGMKSAPRTTSTLVWVFVLLVLGTFAVWQYAASATVKERSALWTSLDEATHDPGAGDGELQKIDSRNRGTIAGRAAGFELARSRLQQGLNSLASDDRVQAFSLLESARDLYGKLLPECVEEPLLAQEAMMGVATAEESLALEENRGNLDKALEYYRDLAKKFPGSFLGRKAAQRATELERQTSRSKIDQFYAEANKKAAPKPNTQAGNK